MRVQDTNTVGPPATSSAACRPSLREANFDDYSRIADCLRRNGLSARPEAEWRRLWNGNPAYEPFRETWPIGWVLEVGQNRMAGCIANLPSLYFWNGEPVRAATACDWAVDADLRSYALLLLHRFANQTDPALLLATTVGTSSEPSYKAFRWSKPAVGQWDRAGFWITGYRGFLRGALARTPVRFAGPLLYPASGALFCRDRLAGLGASRGTSLRVEFREDFDCAFDDFWKKLQRRNPGVLLALRSREALAWRYRAAASKPWIVTVSGRGGLLAYAIFERKDNPEIGLKRLRLVDFQALENHREALSQALSSTLSRCRSTGIHALEDPGCVLESRGLAKAPYHRTLRAWTYYYKPKRADLAEALQRPEAWSPSGLDGDASL